MTNAQRSVPVGLPPATSGRPTARRFEGRICVVTGGASGIGRAAVLRLAAEGGHVIVADVDMRGARETVELAGGKRAGMVMKVDVRSARSVEVLAARARQRVGRLDLLVNNAGIEIQGAIAEMRPEAWDAVMDVNLRGVYLTSRAFQPLLVETAALVGSAAIVNVASLMGLVSAPRLAAYCASKAGVVSLTRSMALDLADTGVRVNCVCPGIVHTPMLERRFAQEPDRSAAYVRTSERPPVGYLGLPEDVAAAIAYLGSDEARFVTGSALVIDGGVGAA